ncbi:T9SS type A sorting domain-containing protein [Candidatus Woesearchaeota archaeon]|nr:T9SS type A sorting domain-containing protein [Candidatus Woesearchaeota archaeon]
MKKNHIIGLLVLVIVVLGALLLSESDSEELQGRIVSRGIVDVEYELNPASPSGAHTVSASDEVFILDFSVDSETMVESGSIMGFSINAASAMENIVVYNLNGQAVINRVLSSTTESIDLSLQATGVYIVKVSIEGVKKSFRIIK